MNKTGIGSLIFGLVLLLLVWYFGFFSSTHDVLGSLAALIVGGFILGGLAWLGLLLAIVGILILVV